jgi:hypothetical protein
MEDAQPDPEELDGRLLQLLCCTTRLFFRLFVSDEAPCGNS